MNKEQYDVRRFLDIEAEVDGEDSSEDLELDDDFIDNETESDLDSSQRPSRRNEVTEREDGFTNFLQNVLKHAGGSGGAKVACDDNTDDDGAISDALRSPTYHDFPLWRIRCRFGLEEDAVFYLLQRVGAEHELRSAFTRGSILGWIYLEATMNEELQILLKSMPGVIRRQTGVVREVIGFEDWKKMLSLRDPVKDVKVGAWVKVLKGKYKGDIGYVSHLEHWGGVRILLVPRLPPPSPAISLLKRKRAAARTEPALFYPDFTKRVYGADPLKMAETTYSFDGLRFEHGLLLKTFDLCSISTTPISIATSTLAQFQRSGHPVLSTAIYPYPSEWIFEEGERVRLVESGQQGVIKAVRSDIAEVELTFGEGLVPVPLRLLRKCVVHGDFVEVNSGVFQGQTGWVDGVHDDVASVVSQRGKRSDEVVQLGNLEHYSVHVNWVKIIDAPFLHALQQSTLTQDRVMCSDRVPWIGTCIVVTKPGHALKGTQAVVRDVLCGQQTATGLRVVAQVASFDPSRPFSRIVMDYDEVVEATLGCQLYEFMQPESDLFRPKNFLPHLVPTKFQSAATTTLTAPTLPWSSSGSGTPMNISTPSSTPAWDPSSRTPVVLTDFAASSPPQSPCTTPPSLPESPRHVLLDLRLWDIMLKVNVSGGEFRDKEMVASLIVRDGRPSLRYSHYRSSIYLAPEWVSPKHPNPTRDNGLLVVIKGDHCGKHVRRIHHRYENGNVVMILAVVEQVENAADHLTGEQLELDKSYLCVGFETAKEKKLNASLMIPLREQARKIRGI